jgi:ribosomal protein L37AE/L43A
VMRTDPEKRFAMIIDHADWTRWHGFLTDPREHSLSASEKREKGKKVKREKAKNCPVCKSFQKHGVSECDNCGYIWPKKEYEHTAEELQVLQANGLTPKRKETDLKVVKNVSPAFLKQQQQAFKTIASQCVQRGHSPKWAWARFKGAFGRWPTEGNGIVHPEYFKKYQEQFSKKNKEEQEEKSKEAKARADKRSDFVKARQQELIGRAGKSSLKDSERGIRIEHSERKLPLSQKVVGQ